MRGGTAQGGVDGVAQGDLYRLVRLVGAVVNHRDRNGARGLAGAQGYRTGIQGVILPAPRGRAAGNDVINRHGQGGFGRQGQSEVHRGNRLGAGGRSGVKGKIGRHIIVVDGIGMLHRGAQGGVHRGAQGDLNGFAGFVELVVHHHCLDVLQRLPRGEGQGAAGQGVVLPAPGGGPAGHGVRHGDGLSRRFRQRYRQGRRAVRLESAGSGVLEGHFHRGFVVGDGVGKLRGGAQRGLRGAAQCHQHGLVVLVQGVVGYGQRYVFGCFSRGKGQGAAGQGVVGAAA